MFSELIHFLSTQVILPKYHATDFMYNIQNLLYLFACCE